MKHKQMTEEVIETADWFFGCCKRTVPGVSIWSCESKASRHAFKDLDQRIDLPAVLERVDKVEVRTKWIEYLKAQLSLGVKLHDCKRTRVMKVA